MAIKNRLHNFLSKIAGSAEAADLAPENEVWYWLNEIAANINSGGGNWYIYVEETA